MASPPREIGGSVEGCGEHLIVVSHGMWGNPFHTAYLVSQLEDALPQQTTHIINLTCNSGIRSYSGVATGGGRIAQVAKAEFERNPRIDSVSFIGYSAGGLWVQHAAMILDKEGFFQKVQPRLFVAVASPLIGVYSPPEHSSHFWFYRSVVNCVGMNLAGCIGGRTVEEIFLSDDDEQPLILQMASPKNAYGQALKKFYRRITFGNTRNDFLVPFESSGLARSNPFPQALEEEEEESFALSKGQRRLVLPLVTPVRPENAWSTPEKLSRPLRKLGWCKGLCEFFQAFGTVVLLLSIWLPIVYTLTIGFAVPLVVSLSARRYYNEDSDRRKSGGGRDAVCPCHCLRGQRRFANRVWREALRGRLAQGFECMPVRFQRGNAHAKIINRPCCCFSNCYADGRISVEEIVALFADSEKHSSVISTADINIQ